MAYEGMDRFFDEDKIVVTATLCGKFSQEEEHLHHEALSYFGLNDQRPVVLVVGGSLGARTSTQWCVSG